MKVPDRAEIERILEEIKEPETGVSIKEMGIVKAVDYVPNSKRLVIYVDFKSRMPSCVACVPIAWKIQESIIRRLIEAFKRYEDVKEVVIKEFQRV